MPLNPEQKDIISSLVDGHRKLREDFSKDILNATTRNIYQFRDLIKNLSIIAGAMASFTLLTLNSNLIQHTNIIIGALITLLIVVGIGFFYLNNILSKENQRLAQLSKNYIEPFNRLIIAGNKVLSEEIKAQTYFEIYQKESSKIPLEVKEEKKNYIGDILVFLFEISLLLIIISFIPF